MLFDVGPTPFLIVTFMEKFVGPNTADDDLSLGINVWLPSGNCVKGNERTLANVQAPIPEQLKLHFTDFELMGIILCDLFYQEWNLLLNLLVCLSIYLPT